MFTVCRGGMAEAVFGTPLSRRTNVGADTDLSIEKVAFIKTYCR